MIKKKTFEIPYLGYDKGEEFNEEYDILIGQYGNPIIGFEVSNHVTQYSSDPLLYKNYHKLLSQISLLLGEGFILQKIDIFNQSIYNEDSPKEYLQKKYVEHFNGRVYTTIKTLLVFTERIEKKYKPNPKVYKTLRDKVSKINLLLRDKSINCSYLKEKDWEYYISRGLTMNYNEIKSFDNIKTSPENLQIGNDYVKTISFIDVEVVDLPDEIGTYSLVGGSGAASNTAIDNFNFLHELKDYKTLIYNQVISIPKQTKTLRHLEKKQRKHDGLKSSSASNETISNEINKFLDHITNSSTLVVDTHFSITYSADNYESFEQLNSNIENNLFTKGIIVSKNSFNQLELFRTTLPGNAVELKEYDLFTTSLDASLSFFFKEKYQLDENSPFYLRFTDRQGIPLKVDPTFLPKKQGRINNYNKFVLGGSGTGKSFLTNSFIEQYLNYSYDCVVVDVGDSYKGTCDYFNGKYITYTEDNPITMNPFNVKKEEINLEKVENLSSLIFLLWKGTSAKISQTETRIINNTIITYYEMYYFNKQDYKNKTQDDIIDGLAKFNITTEQILTEFEKENENISLKEYLLNRVEGLSKKFSINKLSFNSFYDYCLEFLPLFLNNKNTEIKETEFNTRTFLFVLKDFYRGGIYDKTLNEDADEGLFDEKFIVFEIDNIKNNPKLFPVVTMIIMDTFIQKMRHRKGRRKALFIEEAWKAITSPIMTPFIIYLYKTARKFDGEAWVITQELDDIIGNPVMKDTIISNSDTTILLDQSQQKDNFEKYAKILSLNEIEKNKIFTINNLNNKYDRAYFKEFYIKRGLTGEVYGNEVSSSQYWTYTTDKAEKETLERYKKVYNSYQKSIDHIVSDAKTVDTKDNLVWLTKRYKNVLDENLIEVYNNYKLQYGNKNAISAIIKDMENKSLSLQDLITQKLNLNAVA